MLAAPTVDDARLVAEAIGVEPHVEEVLLFGSVARGEADAGSDIDLMVIVHDHTPREATAAARSSGRAAALGNWPCEILFEQRSRWQHLIRNVTASFQAAVASQSVTLFRDPVRLTTAGADPDILGGVDHDDLDVAAGHLSSAANELATLEDMMRGFTRKRALPPDALGDLEPQALFDEARQNLHRHLLATAHLSVELAAKSVRASTGAKAHRVHDIDDLVGDISEDAARTAIRDAIADLPRDENGQTRNWRIVPYEHDDPEWVTETTASNAAAHIRAAVAAVRAASAVLERKAGADHGRATITAALGKAAAWAAALAELNITADSITTGDGLFPVEQPQPPTGQAKPAGFLRRLLTRRTKNASSTKHSRQPAKTDTAAQSRPLLEPASPSTAKCDATTAEGTQCQHPRPAPGGSCAAGHKRA